MADLLKRSEHYAYLRVKVPRGTFETSIKRFGSEAFALREYRRAWESVVARIAADVAEIQVDGSASASRPGASPQASDYAAASRGT